MRAGRPTKAQAGARLDELLDAALDHFLEKGFEPATIEAIAASVSMTKRTVYAQFPDKVTLFRAAVRRAIEALIVAPHLLRGTEGDGLDETLFNIAALRVAQVMTPTGLKLQRIINTKSYRFPDIFTLSYELGALPVVNHIAALLVRETDAGRLHIDEPYLAANIFMSMVVGGPVRVIVSGGYLPKSEIDRRIRYAVRIFLNGARHPASEAFCNGGTAGNAA